MKHGIVPKTKMAHKLVVVSLIISQLVFAFSIPKNAYAEVFPWDLVAETASINAGTSAANTAAAATVSAAIVTALGLGASVLSSSNMNGVMSDVEKRYHINTSSVQNLGETMNTSSNKETVPQTNVFFNPTDPKNGKEITAQAFPMYFSSPKETLYFTWYLKRKNCDLKNDNLSEEEKACDLDGSGSITVNDWKVAAMRRIATGGFSYDQANYSVASNDNDEYKAQFGGDKSKSGYCFVHNFDTGIDYGLVDGGDNNGCKHLFPKTPGHTTGDGSSFDADAERFWQTDPQDPSTAQNGNKDEANVVGLGQDKFTWSYATGDQVGVVIEGLSMVPTKFPDASMQVMWAFSRNKCTPIPTGRSVPGAAYNGGASQIPTANMDVNDCLKDNLIDPTQGDQAGKLDIQLTSSPENPVMHFFSDSKPDRQGSVVTAQSVLSNSVTQSSRVSYEWRVYANTNKSQTDDTAWEDVTQGLIDMHNLSNVKGNDLAALKINLNIDEKTQVSGETVSKRYFKDGVGYLRVNLTATENFEAGKKRVGRASTIIKMTEDQARIQTHAVNVDTSNWKLRFVNPSLTDNGLLCEDNASDRTICPVVKGQIIGVNFNPDKLGLQPNNGADISWTINNQLFHCSSAISQDGDCANGTENFFPVTGDIGETYNVTMTANNPVTGKSITLNRMFSVVEPSLLIVSADSAKVWPKYLGQYVDASGKTTDNYSQDVFEAFAGGAFSLKGLFYPNALKNSASVSWLLNGVAAAPDSAGLLAIDAAAAPGSVYTVSLNGLYSPSQNSIKAISTIWGISVVGAVETKLSRDIQVEIMPSADGIARGPMSGPKKFFASIISYIPTSIIFFFRLIVTMGMILLTLGVIFSLVPEQRKSGQNLNY